MSTEPQAVEPPLTRQCRQILDLIRARPWGVGHEELAAIVSKYTGRISELRQAGYQIHLVKNEDGKRVYKETGLNEGPRAVVPRGKPAYMFLVGPPEGAYVSPAYPTPEARDEAAGHYYNEWECDPTQIYWIDDPGGRRGLKAGAVVVEGVTVGETC